jgi:ubiquitin-conjugating enzyme E2 S
LKHVLLTIKCLLIYPNPESALNEEAGKLLLERYDDYCTRAKIFTEIHAKPKNCGDDSSKGSSSSSSATTTDASAATSETTAKKACTSTTDKKALAKKEKSLKDKKKTLKRL